MATTRIRIPITVPRPQEQPEEGSWVAPSEEPRQVPEQARRQSQDQALGGGPGAHVQQKAGPTVMREALVESELQEEDVLQAFILNLLDVGDNLERALRFAQEGDPVAQGVTLTWRQFLRALAQVNIEPVDSLHQPFDPRQHEAVAVVPSKFPEGIIVDEQQRAYTHHQKLLRPAKVIVSSGPAPVSG